MKLCKDCRHYKPDTDDCVHKGNIRQSLVSGRMRPQLPPDTVREFDKRPSNGDELCGPNATWFEPRQD